jgi:hypothetical protein
MGARSFFRELGQGRLGAAMTGLWVDDANAAAADAPTRTLGTGDVVANPTWGTTPATDSLLDEYTYWELEQQGIQEGVLDNAYGGIFDTLSAAIFAPVKALLKSIPWWVWLLAAGYVGFKLGLFDLAKRKLARA